MKIISPALTFDDVLLTPQYSDIHSRKEIDIGSDLDKNTHLSLPIISAPMDTVTEVKTAIAINCAGGLGIIHRYNSIKEQASMVSKTANTSIVGAAIGATGDFIDRATAVHDAGANILCIDIAHGHHILAKHAIAKLKEVFGDRIHIMVGNVATAEGFKALESWGANSIKVGIGGGSICSTRIQTGHGMPTLQSIFDINEWVPHRQATLIADGGIRTSGDIVKALAAGADFVMLGSMLAGTEESPGEMIMNATGGNRRKVYRGMASKEAQMDWHGRFSSNEGVATTIPYKGKLEDTLEDLRNGIRSGLSYSGVRTVKELQQGALFVKQTLAGQIESSTHITRIN